MSDRRSVVRQIDHITFVVDDPEEVFGVFADVFRFPVVVPLERYEFTDSPAGGLWAGDFDLWIFGPSTKMFVPSGVALEPTTTEDALAWLKEAGFGHMGPFTADHGVRDPEVGRVTETNIFLAEPLGCPVWFAEYGFERSMSRADSRDHFRALLSDGGPLGIAPGGEVCIGATDADSAAANWRTLLRSGDTTVRHWTLGSGPSVKIVSRPIDGIDSLSLRTKRPDDAARALEAAGLLAPGAADGEFVLMSDSLGGINVRLRR